MKEDRIYDWISKGAQPSDSVMQLFKTTGLLERYERYKAGEALEALMKEAQEAETARTGSPKTSRISTSKPGKVAE
jgi:small subunit ribosomal protein S16